MTAKPEPDSLELRPEVAAFAQAMERQMRANDHKPGWDLDDRESLMARLREETVELEDVIGIHVPGTAVAPQVTCEAADVANFAMMLACNYGDLYDRVARARLESLRGAKGPTQDKQKATDAPTDTICPAPQERFSEEEREALEWAIEALGDWNGGTGGIYVLDSTPRKCAATLRAMLGRKE